MKIVYFDTIAGIAGDMAMAALVSAGVPIDELATELRKLSVGGFEVIGSHVQRNGISAVHIDVTVAQEPHYHRHLPDILSIIHGSSFSARVKERSESVYSHL